MITDALVPSISLMGHLFKHSNGINKVFSKCPNLLSWWIAAELRVFAFFFFLDLASKLMAFVGVFNVRYMHCNPSGCLRGSFGEFGILSFRGGVCPQAGKQGAMVGMEACSGGGGAVGGMGWWSQSPKSP